MSTLALREPFFDHFGMLDALDAIDTLLTQPEIKRRCLRKLDGSVERIHAIKSEVIETDRDIQVHLEAPGMTKDNIDITVDNNELVVKFNRTKPTKDKETVLSSDFAYGMHTRRFKLPKNINQDDVTATYENGVLCVKFNKSNQTAPKKLTIS